MRALIVDDDMVFRSLANGILTRIGFTVEVARTELEAVTITTSGPPPTLALIDWNLGTVMGGLNVIRRLRSRPGTHQTCICLWSVERDRHIWNTAIHAGANAVLPKPLGPEHMWQLLSRLGVLTLPENAPAVRSAGAI